MKNPIKKLLSFSLPLIVAIPLVCNSTNVFAVSFDNNPMINQPINVITTTASQPLTLPQPPANWDPLNAPDKELTLYGYPTRPIDEHQLETWKKYVFEKFHNDPQKPFQSYETFAKSMIQLTIHPAAQLAQSQFNNIK